MLPDGSRDLVAGPDSGPAPPFPLKLNGKVIEGFGRGSKELGIPTANIPLSGLSVGGHEEVESGVYFGWAGISASRATRASPPSNGSGYNLMTSSVYDSMRKFIPDGKEKEEQGAVYPMVMSIGYNPVYKNEVRSVEVHVMQDFKVDFYQSHMNVSILGFIRPELDYISKEKLIEDIKTDIDVAGRSLARKAYAEHAKDPYLMEFSGRSEMAS